MANEVSNKALAVLLVFTIVISLGGTMLSLNRLKKIELKALTGADILEQEGNIQANVTSNTAINFTTYNVSFGTGTVASGCQNCTMHTPGVNDTPDCCVGFAPPTTGLVIENIGNENASLSLNFSNNGDAMIGGSNPLFDMNITENEAGACANTSAAGSGLAETWKATFNSVPTDNPEVCDVFQPSAAKDSLVIDIKVRIPDNSLTGFRNTTVTATATQI